MVTKFLSWLYRQIFSKKVAANPVNNVGGPTFEILVSPQFGASRPDIETIVANHQTFFLKVYQCFPDVKFVTISKTKEGYTHILAYIPEHISSEEAVEKALEVSMWMVEQDPLYQESLFDIRRATTSLV